MKRPPSCSYFCVLNLLLLVTFASTIVLLSIERTSFSSIDSRGSNYDALFRTEDPIATLPTTSRSSPNEQDMEAIRQEEDRIFGGVDESEALVTTTKSPGSPPENFTKIAMFADSTLNDATKLVLELVKKEKADMIFHPGDLDYTGKVEKFEEQVSSILGKNFPYFFSAGNYENKVPSVRETTKRKNVWRSYVTFRKRLFQALGVKCVYSMSDQAQVACHYKGISFVLSNLSNLKGKLHSDSSFVREGLARLRSNFPQAKWTFCLWHAPFYTMQIGFRSAPMVMRSEHLENAYEYCRKAGAMVVTGHEHYYVRTHEMKSFKAPYEFVKPVQEPSLLAPPRLRGSDDDAAELSISTLKVGNGSTFAVVTGLGGHSVSIPSEGNFKERNHLGVVHPLNMLSKSDPGGKVIFPKVNGDPTTSSNLIRKVVDDSGYPFGALFCELPLGESQNRGYCYFKTIDDKVTDEFYVERSM